MVTRLGGRAMFCAGARPGLRIVHCLNYQLWTGGVTDHMIIEASGATAPCRSASARPRKLLETIAELGVTGIHCTPSYPALLEKVLREEMHREPRSLGLQLGLFGGEAGLDHRAFRSRLEATWGFKVRNANFGLSEVMSILGSQCEHTSGSPLPRRGRRLRRAARSRLRASACRSAEGHAPASWSAPTSPRRCQPLVRYRTRDVLTVTGDRPCPCGRGTLAVPRDRPDRRHVQRARRQRLPDRCAARGDARRADLASGHFRIVLVGPEPYDRIPVRAEAAPELPPERWRGAAAELERRIRAAIGASATVTLLPVRGAASHRGQDAAAWRRSVVMSFVTLERQGPIGIVTLQPAGAAQRDEPRPHARRGGGVPPGERRSGDRRHRLHRHAAAPSARATT